MRSCNLAMVPILTAWEGEAGHYNASQLWGHLVFYIKHCRNWGIYSFVLLHSCACQTFPQLCATIHCFQPNPGVEHFVNAKWTMCAFISRLVKHRDWVCRESGPGGNKSVTYCHSHLKTDDSALSQSPTPSVSQNMPMVEQQHLKTTRRLWLVLTHTHKNTRMPGPLRSLSIPQK